MSLSSNMVYLVWAVFGGFILHFLLSNYLTVLLRPSYEKPVDTTEDLINRDITPFSIPGSDYYIQYFAESPDPNYQEISKRFVVPKDWDEYRKLVGKVTSTGLFADINSIPAPWVVPKKDHNDWYRSSETLEGQNSYVLHLSNKRWPLKKVFNIVK